MRLFSHGLQLSRVRRLEVYREVADRSAPPPTFYVVVAISATIAAYGLPAPSTAVVIGATLTDFRYRRHDGRLARLAVVQTPVGLAAEQVEAMQSMLQRDVDPGADVVVRWTVGADSGAEGGVSRAAGDARVAEPVAAPKG